MDLHAAFFVLRVFAGLVIAGHGAQKVAGWAGGPGLERWKANVERMGMQPHRLWAHAAAWGELVGGTCLAAGLLTGVAAGVLVMDMIVAIWKVHAAKGFWISRGGYEYALTDLVVFALVGLAGPGVYALDTPLRLASWSAPLFLVTIVLGLVTMWSGTRPAVRIAGGETEVERRRHHAA